MPDVAASSELSQVKTIKEMDAQKGFGTQQDDNSVNISDSKIINYSIKKPNKVTDCNW